MTRHDAQGQLLAASPNQNEWMWFLKGLGFKDGNPNLKIAPGEISARLSPHGFDKLDGFFHLADASRGGQKVPAVLTILRFIPARADAES